MSTMPKRRSHASDISRILDTQIFICSGKAKYGSPSIIMTIPSTQRKKSIDSSIHFSPQGNIAPELVVFLQNGHPDRGLVQRRKKIARPLTMQSGSRPLSNNQSNGHQECPRIPPSAVHGDFFPDPIPAGRNGSSGDTTGNLFMAALLRTEGVC